MDIFFLFRHKPKPLPPEIVQMLPGDGYESEYPMLPKEVIYKAVDGGFDFHGSLGPENVLDIKLFRALAPNRDENVAHILAHKAYDFYLYYFTLPKETAQEKAVEFWHELIKP